MTDTDDRYSENQGTSPSARPHAPSIDASDSPELKRPHRSRKGHSARRQGRDKSRRGGTRKQAQEIAGKPASPHVESDLEEVVFEAEGKKWTVRVTGRSKTKTATLLMLGFWVSPESGDAPDRETLITGRSLAELNLDQLQSAYEHSSPPPTDQSRDFFSDIHKRGRK